MVARCFEINYAISSLAQSVAAPRQGYLNLGRNFLEYLKKYLAKQYIINSSLPCIPDEYQKVKIDVGFGNQYCYSMEDIGLHFQKTFLLKLNLNIFVDADHVQKSTPSSHSWIHSNKYIQGRIDSTGLRKHLPCGIISDPWVQRWSNQPTSLLTTCQ